MAFLSFIIMIEFWHASYKSTQNLFTLLDKGRHDVLLTSIWQQE